MNILIVGDFSSLSINLKAGFLDCGHNVVIVRTRDGFKNYIGEGDDIIYTSNRRLKLFGKPIPKTHYFTALFDNYKIKSRIKNVSDYFDVIVVTNEVFVTTSPFYAGVPLKFIQQNIKLGAKMVMMSCGGDSANIIYGNLLKYIDYSFPNGHLQPSYRTIKKFDELIKLATVICPISYSYYATIKEYCKNKCLIINIKCVHVPIIIRDYCFNSCVGRKVVIIHGKSRPDKGSVYIEEACNKIQHDYKDLVDIRVLSPMEYNKYIKVFDNADILIDQTNGYGIGMNAAIGLMKGLVVLGGNEPENQECMGIKSPVVNIIPDTKQIYNALKNLILNRDQIDLLKQESRRFAEDNLSAVSVAKRILSCLN